MFGKVLLVLFILLILAGLAWVIWTLIEERRRQARMMLRMRRDAERQERAIVRLAEGLNASMRQVNHLSESMEARQDRMRRTLDERMTQMQQSNDQSLEKVRQTVSDKLDGRLNESFRLVNAELANVHRGLGEMREITTGMTDLKKMLGGVKTRGVWGEVQLRALMAELFAPGQYVENVAIPEGSQQRVEFALRLPTGEDEVRLLPIDAKFPQEDYLRVVEAEESGDREAVRRCAAQLERAVLEQARRIHDKYIHPPIPAGGADRAHPGEVPGADLRPRHLLRAAHQHADGLPLCDPREAQRRGAQAPLRHEAGLRPLRRVHTAHASAPRPDRQRARHPRNPRKAGREGDREGG